MFRHRLTLMTGALAALGLLAADAQLARAQAVQAGPVAGYTTGSATRIAPARGGNYDPYRTNVQAGPGTVYPPIMMTTINTPGIYGAYSFGVSDLTLFNRDPPFYRAYNPRRDIPNTNTTVVTGATTEPATGTASVRVYVPSDAELTVQGVPMPGAGTTRDFVTPPMPLGQRFRYDIRATWRQDGRDVTQTRRVYVRANDSVDVDLNPVDTGPTLKAGGPGGPERLPPAPGR